jgi:hypothetical protein
VCGLCSIFEAREKILQPKWDTLKKHGGKRKAKKAIPKLNVKKGQWYVAENCKHLQNERRYARRSIQRPVIVQLLEVKGERARKRKQMQVIFHLLQMGRPMIEYEAMKPLLGILGVKKLAQRHWGDNSGWGMAHHMNL